LQIHRQAALVPVRTQKKRTHAVDEGAGPRPVALVRAGNRFDLDDVRAKIRQILRGGRALQVMAQSQHFHSVQHIVVHYRRGPTARCVRTECPDPTENVYISSSIIFIPEFMNRDKPLRANRFSDVISDEIGFQQSGCPTGLRRVRIAASRACTFQLLMPPRPGGLSPYPGACIMGSSSVYTPEGVIPAVLMPFQADLEIDRGAYQRHVQDLAGTAGVTGLVVNGHAAEVHTLSFDEQKLALDLTLDTVGDK